MREYLQLILIALFIGLLSLYIGSVSILKSFDIPILRDLRIEAEKRKGLRSPSQELMHRQKRLTEQRQRDLKDNMRRQKQQIKENARRLKQRIRDLQRK